MAYLKPIAKPKCPCGKPATQTLVNVSNSNLGDYCSSCAKRKLAELLKREAASYTEGSDATRR